MQIVTELSDEHSLRASLPRVATLSGKTMDESEGHFWNAPIATEVTVLGMLTDLRFAQSAKAPIGIVVTPSPISTDVIELRTLYQGVSLFLSQGVMMPEPVMVSFPPLRS